MSRRFLFDPDKLLSKHMELYFDVSEYRPAGGQCFLMGADLLPIQNEFITDPKDAEPGRVYIRQRRGIVSQYNFSNPDRNATLCFRMPGEDETCFKYAINLIPFREWVKLAEAIKIEESLPFYVKDKVVKEAYIGTKNVNEFYIKQNGIKKL